MTTKVITEKNAAELIKGEENLLECDTSNYIMKYKDELSVAIINNVNGDLLDKDPGETARKVWRLVDAIFNERSFFKPIY